MAPEEDQPDIRSKEGESDASASTLAVGTTMHSQRSSSFKKVLHAGRNVPLVELQLENVTYAPMTKTASANATSSQRKTILNNISTRVAPYQLSAWMGPSGSGKTSLISVAADLIRPGDLIENSVIKVNGEEGRIPKRLVGVVWQDDLLLSNLTVQENVYFAARLKTPEDTSDAVVRETVQYTLEELGLSHRSDSLVGSPLMGIRGVSGGERKRVSVAVELVAQPSLLLLDEPTSGLDATTALALMSTLKELASHGHSIAVVIHQPRTTIYNQFDHLLLLSKGNAIYNGPPCGARAFLEACPSVSELPPETGIADWIMDVITEDEQMPGGGVLAKHWTEKSASAECKQAQQGGPPKLIRQLSTLEVLQTAPKFGTGFATQLKLLTQRSMKQQRGERLTSTALFLQFIFLFFTAIFWWRLPNTTAYVFERNSLFFFIIIAQANGVVVNAVTVFHRERALLYRERAKKMYGVGCFYLAKTISDMTTNVLLPVLYGMIVYWIANFRPTAAAFFKFTLSYYLTISTAQSMGLFMSIAISSSMLAMVLAPPLTLFFIIMGGFYVPFKSMNVAIRWATWLSFARYGYTSLIVNEYEGRDIPCADGGSVQIGSYDECPVPGEDVIAGLGIHGVAGNYWFNVGMILALQIAFRLGAYVLLRRSK